jgi:hypothetical protein
MTTEPVAQAENYDLAFHTLGWKAFQDLCAQVCEEILGRLVSVYREAQDDGQDAVFLLPRKGIDDAFEEATVQCKFSGKADRRLRASDITKELSSVEKLVQSGRAHTYYLITNFGIDSGIASEVREMLVGIGVRRVEVLGREWLTLQIKASARLRALVPRVYGLGDLSSIIDERHASQTKALLGHLLPSLKVYVPTVAHRSAVRILSEHKLVLLLGPPAAGKSMLAAILSTTAIDKEQYECLKCEGPVELRAHWNPNLRDRLFWIDDAFGPNQLRNEYIDAWIEFMPKMRAAMEQGNNFILTSRTHIWNAARHKLGTRNHPLLADDTAVVDVGSLSSEERQQILYNHVKSGNQSKAWKGAVRWHLKDIAQLSTLLPEIARRLSDPSYTTGIKAIPHDLVRFVSEPQTFLKETLLELSEAHQAAMTLVFLARSRLPEHAVGGEECKLVAEKYGVSVASVTESLSQLLNSFLLKRIEGGQMCWGFIHPTFVDAISSILSVRPDLVELYVRGTRLENLLGEALCEGTESMVRDAVIVPASSFDKLIGRLVDAPNVVAINELIFQFLVFRCPASLFRSVIEINPSILSREGEPRSWQKIRWNSRVRLRSRALSLGLLSRELRADTAYDLEYEALNNLDIGFFEDDSILGLFEPTDLVRLTIKLTQKLTEDVPSRIEELGQSADPNGDVDDHFSYVTNFVEYFKYVGVSGSEVEAKAEALDSAIEDTKNSVLSRKKPEDDSGSFWSDIAPAKVRTIVAGRSIFSDVDE